MTYEPVLPPTTDILATYDDAPPPRRAPWLVVALAGAVVLALVAGVSYGVRFLSGGGARPAEALPSGAFVFAEADLDPGAGQKVDGFRFLRQFPSLRDKLSSDDLRRTIFESIADDAGWAEIDYATDVEPWLGSRLAVAAYEPGRFGGEPGAAPGDGSGSATGAPVAVVALQITDEEKARAGLARLVAAAGGQGSTDGTGSGGFVVAGDYALLAETRGIAEQAAQAAGEGSMASDGTLTADLAALGGDSVGSVWVDLAAAGRIASLANPLGLGAVGNLAGVGTATGGTGRAAYVVRFDGPDAVEVAGRVTGASALEGIGPATVEGMADLPATSVVALGLAGGSDLVGPLWQAVRAQASSAGADPDDMEAKAERQLGLDLPEALAALLGSNLLAVLDGEHLGDGQTDFGVVTRTDPQAVRPVIDALQPLLAQTGQPIQATVTDDGYLLASSPAAADRLTGGAGSTLGDSAAFNRALPDLEGARVAVWVDVAPLVSGFTAAFGGGALDDDLAPLAGLGMTMSTDGGNGEFRLRLVTD